MVPAGLLTVDEGVTFTAELWRWTAREESDDAGAWSFVTLPPDLAINTVWTFLISVVVLIIGQSVFRRLEGRFAQDL